MGTKVCMFPALIGCIGNVCNNPIGGVSAQSNHTVCMFGQQLRYEMRNELAPAFVCK